MSVSFSWKRLFSKKMKSPVSVPKIFTSLFLSHFSVIQGFSCPFYSSYLSFLSHHVVFNLSLLRGGSEPTILGTSAGTLGDWDVPSLLSL